VVSQQQVTLLSRRRQRRWNVALGVSESNAVNVVLTALLGTHQMGTVQEGFEQEHVVGALALLAGSAHRTLKAGWHPRDFEDVQLPGGLPGVNEQKPRPSADPA
jgi:hypothetical protein